VAKFREAVPPTLEVIGEHLVNFKPIFDGPFEKNCKEGPVLSGGALAKFDHSLTCVKIRRCSTLYGPKYGLPKKLIWLSMIPPLNLCN